MGAHPDPQWLARTPLFEGVSKGQLAVLSQSFERREYDAGQVLLSRDQRGFVFYIIESGRAHAEIDGKVMEVLETGSVFGEIAFFTPDGLRTATIVAESPLRVWSMFGTAFRKMLDEQPEVAARLDALATERSNRTTSSDRG